MKNIGLEFQMQNQGSTFKQAAILDGLSQEKIKEISDLKRKLSGVLSLYCVRSNKNLLLALVVATDGDDAKAQVGRVVDWDSNEIGVRSVQRNVDMEPGILNWVAWKANGEHHTKTVEGRASQIKKKRKQRNRFKIQRMAQLDAEEDKFNAIINK